MACSAYCPSPGQAKIDSSSTAPAKMWPAMPPIRVTTGSKALRRL